MLQFGNTDVTAPNPVSIYVITAFTQGFRNSPK